MNVARQTSAHQDRPTMHEPAKILPFEQRRPPWFVLRVFSGRERMVVEGLNENGVTAYRPQQTTWARFATRKAPRTRPLMPGYVFACLPNDHAIFLALDHRAVVEIMCRDGKPVRIDPTAIGSMIFLEACFAWDETWEPPKIKGRRYSHAWKSGDRVRVSGGPFSGFVATVQRGQGKDHMQVLLTIFGRPTEIVVPHKQLTKPDTGQNAAETL